MDEHQDRTGSFDQPATAVTHRARSSRAPGMLAAVAVVGSMAVAMAASALAETSLHQRDRLGVAGASASAQTSSSPDRPKREKGRQLGRFGRIEMTSVDGNRIGLRTEDGWTRTITVTADTRIVRGGEDATLADLRVGDVIVLRQRRNDDGTFTVTAIAVPAPRVGGTVTAVAGDTITVTPRRGEPVEITVTPATRYLTGRDAGSRADLRIGSRITAQGDLEAASGFVATVIRIASPVVDGVVTAVGDSTITVTRRDGTAATVHVDADTAYRVRGKGRAATLADVAVGARIVATGTLRADGSLDATTVAAGRARTAEPETAPGG